MRLASLKQGGRDGTLVVVSSDLTRGIVAPAGVPTLQAALDDWAACEPELRRAGERLEQGEPGVAIDVEQLASPLPRAYQWCEGSTYLTHMERMRRSRGAPMPATHGREPNVSQTGSGRFLAPREPIPLPDEDWGLDLEATVAVVTDDVPIGTTREQAVDRIRLVLLANDLTYRELLPAEYAKGAGTFRSKPARSFSPFAVAPDALGAAWDGALLRSTIRCTVNDDELGRLRSDEGCSFSFPVLIEYMTMTRSLPAGAIVGSGTVANADAERGHGCLGERRAVELSSSGAASTEYLRRGDRVRIEAFDEAGRSLFGAIEQRVVAPADVT